MRSTEELAVNSATSATSATITRSSARVADESVGVEIDRSEIRQVARSNAPRTFPCPDCGIRGRRVRKRTLEVIDLEPRQRVRIIATVGVYKSRCECRKYFTSEIREASKGTEYSLRVRDKVVSLVVDDGLTYEKVRECLRVQYKITVSIGTIHNWLKERGATPARTRISKKARAAKSARAAAKKRGGARRTAAAVDETQRAAS